MKRVLTKNPVTKSQYDSYAYIPVGGLLTGDFCMLTGIEGPGMGLIGFTLPLMLQDCTLGTCSFLTLQLGVSTASDFIFVGNEVRLPCGKSKSTLQ